ncbi:MAG TPA: hypothetical protein VI356_00530 [Myxococcales bacterium]
MQWLRQRWVVFGARRRERRALEKLGDSLPAGARIAALDEALRAIDAQAASSLRRDRDEYAGVSAWARPLVVARGLLDRAILRERARRCRADRRDARVRLGEESLQDATGSLADAARAASAARASAVAALSPLPLPLREAGHMSGHVLRELRGQILIRVPALVGLAVGWWIGQTFTDSELSATLHGWGIGSGPRHAVHADTLRAMRFWLPLLAAALASYAGSRLAALVRSRYSPAEDAVVPREELR